MKRAIVALAVLCLLASSAAAAPGRKVLAANAVAKTVATGGSTAVAKSSAVSGGALGGNAFSNAFSGASRSSIASTQSSAQANNGGAQADSAAVADNLGFASVASSATANQSDAGAAAGSVNNALALSSGNAVAVNQGTAVVGQTVAVHNNIIDDSAQTGTALITSGANADNGTAIATADVEVNGYVGPVVGQATLQQQANAKNGGLAFAKLKGRVYNGGIIGNDADFSQVNATGRGPILGVSSFAELDTDLEAADGGGAFVGVSRVSAQQGGLALGKIRARATSLAGNSALAFGGVESQAAGDLAASSASTDNYAISLQNATVADGFSAATANVPGGKATADTNSLAVIQGTATSTAFAQSGQALAKANAQANATTSGFTAGPLGQADSTATAASYKLAGEANANATADSIDGSSSTAEAIAIELP